MRVIAWSTCRSFCDCHPHAEAALRRWHQQVEAAAWESAADVKAWNASVSVLTASRFVFNIGGNSYRLVADIDFTRDVLFIKFIGTHADYDRIDATTVRHQP